MACNFEKMMQGIYVNSAWHCPMDKAASSDMAAAKEESNHILEVDLKWRLQW